jgi:hypothetical protein
MTDTLTVGGISAKPGSKAFGFLSVAERPGTTIQMPIGIVNGSQTGPILCLTAGKHAAEYPGIDAVIGLYRETDPEKLKGALLTVPVVNLPAFDTQTPFVCPIDNKDVAYLAPGKRTGTISHRIAYVLTEEIVKKADYYIDLHGGDLSEWVVPWCICPERGDPALDKETEKLGRLYATEFIEKTNRPIMNIGKDIPAFVGEAGGLGTYDEADISKHMEGVRNVMKYLGMMDGKPIRPGRQLMFRTEMPEGSLDSTESAGFHILSTDRGGLLYPKVKPGDSIEQGQVVGEVRNLRGEVVERIVAPSSCTVIMIYPKHVVSAGDPVLCTATVVELPPLEL